MCALWMRAGGAMGQAGSCTGRDICQEPPTWTGSATSAGRTGEEWGTCSCRPNRSRRSWKRPGSVTGRAWSPTLKRITAGRLWWALRFYGHDQVAVLYGGWTRWVAEGRLVSTEVPHPALATFTTHPRPQLLALARKIEQALLGMDARVRLLDTRPAEQYAGQAIWKPHGSLVLPPGLSWIALPDGRVMRGGHIPGAMHLHASRLLNPVDWTYLPRESLQALVRGEDLEPEQRVITYCGSGISASLGLFALHLAGYRDIALYDASWEEGGTDAAFPVELEAV